MGKFIGAMVLLVIAAALAGCESGGAAATTASAGNGKTLGDTWVRVSGSVEAGGSTMAR